MVWNYKFTLKNGINWQQKLFSFICKHFFLLFYTQFWIVLGFVICKIKNVDKKTNNRCEASIRKNRFELIHFRRYEIQLGRENKTQFKHFYLILTQVANVVSVFIARETANWFHFNFIYYVAGCTFGAQLNWFEWNLISFFLFTCDLIYPFAIIYGLQICFGAPVATRWTLIDYFFHFLHLIR